MQQYLDLLRHVLTHGERKPTRTKEEGSLVPLDALSVFGQQLRFDLRGGFPLATTKRVPFGAIAHELIWFLRGSTNVRYLQENKVTIWDEWADPNGDLGPVYGKQWRSWECPDGRTVDQIRYVLDGIRRVRENPRDSVGRRLLVSAWNVADLDRMALAPCHTLFQFSVTGDRLDCQLYQRSADVFLGVPFNIASYALLTHLVAHVTGLVPGEFIHTFGDVHVYENHLDQVRLQLTRSPLPLPTLHIDPALRDLDALRFEHLRLEGYQSHPAIKGKVAV